MKKVLIKNIKGLVQVGEDIPKMLKGAEMKSLPIIENAFLALEDGVIVAYGPMEDWGGITDWRDLEIIDADGKFVLPAFCDAHTHTVFAKSREEEFVDRINGLTYEEIALKGGGILNSARRLADMSEDELKMLRVIKRLKESAGIEIKATFLGAHAFPKEYKENHRGYIDLIINEMLPKIAEEKLADFIDVFCERNYFSLVVRISSIFLMAMHVY